jgi:hypothetical protein
MTNEGRAGRRFRQPLYALTLLPIASIVPAPWLAAIRGTMIRVNAARPPPALRYWKTQTNHLPELLMAASPTEIPKPATVNEIRGARYQDREAQPSDEKRTLAALEELADTTEAIRQEIVHFENLVERLILSQRAQF